MYIKVMWLYKAHEYLMRQALWQLMIGRLLLNNLTFLTQTFTENLFSGLKVVQNTSLQVCTNYKCETLKQFQSYVYAEFSNPFELWICWSIWTFATRPCPTIKTDMMYLIKAMELVKTKLELPIYFHKNIFFLNTISLKWIVVIFTSK